jgi:hypothetical protein
MIIILRLSEFGEYIGNEENLKSKNEKENEKISKDIKIRRIDDEKERSIRND